MENMPPNHRKAEDWRIPGQSTAQNTCSYHLKVWHKANTVQDEAAL